ncbi:MAG: hypothetical protein QME40_03550 [bacterium]|nr:hypothetical protein [bacterium]
MKRIVLPSFVFYLLSSVFCLSQEIKVPEVLIEGEDKSHIEREEEETPIEFESKFEGEKREATDEVLMDERKGSPYEGEKEEIVVEETPSPKFDFKISYGTYDSLSYELQGKQERRQFGYSVGILRRLSSGFKEYEKVFNDFSQDDLYAKTNLYFDKWNLSARLGYYRKNLDLPYNDKEKGMCIDIDLRSKIKAGVVSNLYLNLYGDTSKKKDLESQTFNPEVKFNTIWKGYDLTFGVESFRDRLGDYFKVWGKGDHIKLDPLLLNLRLGLDKWSKRPKDFFVEGFVSFSYGIKDIILNVLMEREISFPDFNRLYLKRDYVRVREDISETKGWILRIGFDYKPYPYLKFTGSVFYKDMDDLVTWEEKASLFEISQIDKEIFGMDSTLGYKIIKDLSADLNLSYVDKYIPLKPKLELGLALNYAHRIAYLRLITTYIGKREALSDYIIVGAEVSRNVSSHFTIFLQGETAEGKVSPEYPGHPGKLAIGAKASF